MQSLSSTASRAHTRTHADRPLFHLTAPGQPTLALQVQRPSDSPSQLVNGSDVLYVHGSTFGADLSVFHRFDGRSWADALNDAGHTVWGLDWAGYGHSERYPHNATTGPVGRMADVLPQLRRAIAAIRARNADRPVAVIAHSWGASVAAAYASQHPQDLRALVLFGPIVRRPPAGNTGPAAPVTSHYPVSLWAQYRRFVEDVPRGQPQVLSETHFQDWGDAYLATDASAATRLPPSVWTPAGPGADLHAWWSGNWLYEPTCVEAPTLLVRGAWDSLCTDADAATLLDALGSTHKVDCTIERATHLMHLESQREVLYRNTNELLLQHTTTTKEPA